MAAESNIQNEARVLKLQGTLNLQNVAEWKSQIDEILQGTCRIVVLDMEELEEIDSSGIGAIVSLLKRMRTQKRDVRIYRLRGTVQKLFQMLRLDKSMEVFDDLSKAKQC